MKAFLPHFVHTLVQSTIYERASQCARESRDRLAADAKPVLKQRALTTLQVRRQADDCGGIIATVFAIQPLVRRHELLQRHPVAIVKRPPLPHDLHDNVPMPPQYGHKVKGLPAK